MKLPKVETSKTIDFAVVVLLVLAGAAYNLLAVDTLFGKALFGMAAIIIPSVIYLGFRRKKPWRKIALATFIFGTVLGFFFEFIQEYAQAYQVVSRVFPKILGVVPPDNILGHTMMALLAFMFYEHFLASPAADVISRRGKKMLLVAIGMAGTVLAVYFVQPQWLDMPYSYAIFGTLALVPMAVHVYRHPKSVKQLAWMVPAFFALYLLIEVFAVRYSWWIYPGHYLGYVSVVGVTFPFEEMFFWMTFYAAALVSYYMIFIETKPPVRS